MTAAAGFLLGARGQAHLGLLAAMLVGLSLVIASACVFNNYLDRGIDAVMARTKRRALVSGAVSGPAALVYGAVLGLAGLALLVAYTNALTVAIGLVGFIDYVALYGWAKRHTVHSTLVGSVSGAAPIVAGYCAATGRLDTGAALLFVILVAWQMPHFYAIALYRGADYAAAKLPVLPLVHGVRAAKQQIMIYIVVFAVATLALAAYGYAGWVYAIVMTAAGLVWLRLAWQGFRAASDERWARRLFRYSLIILLIFSLMIAITSMVP
jgi:protoheme IX farnesyltransferase